jgi:hypothetical protein
MRTADLRFSTTALPFPAVTVANQFTDQIMARQPPGGGRLLPARSQAESSESFAYGDPMHNLPSSEQMVSTSLEGHKEPASSS